MHDELNTKFIKLSIDLSVLPLRIVTNSTVIKYFNDRLNTVRIMNDISIKTADHICFYLT